MSGGFCVGWSGCWSELVAWWQLLLQPVWFVCVLLLMHHDRPRAQVLAGLPQKRNANPGPAQGVNHLILRGVSLAEGVNPPNCGGDAPPPKVGTPNIEGGDAPSIEGVNPPIM